MSINIGYACTRYSFFFFNILFWILGCGSLGVGVWLYVVKTEYETLTSVDYGALSAAGLCIAAGSAVVVIGFVGCCGAWVESRCLLLTYFVFVVVVFIVELTSGVLGFLYRDEVTETVRHEMFLHLNGKRAPLENDIRTWEQLQTQFSCCGVDSFEDWFRSPRWKSLTDQVPVSCCDPDKVGSLGGKCGLKDHSDVWFKIGCYEAFSTWLLEHVHIVGVIGITLASIQIFGLVCSALLYCGLLERERSGCIYHKQQ